MSKSCELCGKPMDQWPTPPPVMSGEQRMNAWITGLVALGFVCLSGVAYKACARDKDLDQARLPIEVEARRAEAQVRTATDRSYNEAQKAKADAERAAAEAKTAEAQSREASRREIYKACLAASNDPALCSGQLQTVRCLPTGAKP